MKTKSGRADTAKGADIAYRAGYEACGEMLRFTPRLTPFLQAQWLEGRADALREYLAGWDAGHK